MRFRDRAEAGRMLADKLSAYAGTDVVVLALPRGGVPVALEVARRLGATLDVIGVRKLGAPRQPEFGFGAVAEDGVFVVDGRSVAALGLDDDTIRRIADREREEIQRRLQAYRGGRDLPSLEDRTVIVVDDGLATGVTARAALRAVRGHGPRRLVLAVPVGATHSVEALQAEADEVVCVHAADDFMAVGAWYEHFEQTTNDEVVRALEEAGARRE